ncbi:MAG: DUF4012 domain-containing protein [Chloroflexi bacterium]|nr:DUF4012 domain-containing protein [Chloroflexota bacterium]
MQSGRRARRGRTSRVRLLVAGLVAVAIVAYVAITGTRFLLAYGELKEAKELMLSAESTLRKDGPDASPDTLDGAQVRLLAARAKLDSARRLLDGDPLLRAAERLPALGPQLSAVRSFIDIGREGADVGLAGIEALRSYDAVRADKRPPLGERVVAFLEAVRPEMASAEASLALIQEERLAMEGDWLLPPLAGLLEEVDGRLPRLQRSLERYRDGQRAAPGLLGFRGGRRYLVLGLDNTELMPGGGLIGSYGVITLQRGRLRDRTFGEVEDVIDRWQERSGGEYIEPPGPLKRYLLRDWTWNFGIADWSPDFPTSARQALFFYERSGAEPVDGVIALDFATLEGLLEVLGPVRIERYGVTVDAENVTEEVLARIGRPLRPGQGDHAFARAVARRVIDEAMDADGQEWQPLLRRLERLAEEKHLFVYSGDAGIERSLGRLGWAGEVREEPGDYLMVVNASVHSTKLNLALRERFDVRVRLDAAGNAHHGVTLRYENRLDEWAAGRDPQFVSDLMLSGFYGGYVRVLTPKESRLREVRLNGEAAGVEEVTQEAGRLSFGRYVPLPRDARASLEFAYLSPGVVEALGGVRTYRLLLQKQPGTGAIPLRLTVELPAGASVTSVTLGGRELPPGRLRIETDLSRDRELVVEYEP